MYAITGITGKVGGELAKTLLAQGQPVRAVVRDAKKGEAWAALSCEIAFADMDDAAALLSLEFMIGSAVRHPHDLVLGYYSVHTSAGALQIGEAQIDAIRDTLVAKGRL